MRGISGVVRKFCWLLNNRDCAETSPLIHVNVFVAHDPTLAHHQLLVLPATVEPEIHEHLRHLNWRELASTHLGDKLLSSARPVIEAQFVQGGHSLLQLIR